jgi:hypothetical protein
MSEATSGAFGGRCYPAIASLMRATTTALSKRRFHFFLLNGQLQAKPSAIKAAR